MKFIKATCPGCGASLELADHLQSANCPNCGSKILIDWETKQNPAAYLELAKRFIESKNYKEADAQLTRVLEMRPDNKKAWFLKGLALALDACNYYKSQNLGGTYAGYFVREQAELDAKHKLAESYLKQCGYSKNEMVDCLATNFSRQTFYNFYNMDTDYFGRSYRLGFPLANLWRSFEEAAQKSR